MGKIELKSVPLSSKVMLDRSEYESLAPAAKKYMTQEKKERHLQKLLEATNKLISELKSKVAALTAELAEYKSVRGKLHTNELEQENAKLRDKLHSYEAVIDRHDLWHLFGRKRSKTAVREESRRFPCRTVKARIQPMGAARMNGASSGVSLFKKHRTFPALEPEKNSEIRRYL